MTTFLLGHRGVGKTALLSRIEKYFCEEGLAVKVYDLDAEIERLAGKSIAQIFADHGESHFRSLEKKVAASFFATSCVQAYDTFVALGAGFDGELPEGSEKIWVRRETDSAGRIFLNRPRLNSAVAPLAEYQERFAARENFYSQICDRVYTMGEGFDFANSAERDFFLGRINLSGASVTLTAPNLAKKISAILNANVRYVELRDDLLSTDEMSKALELLPVEKVLLSFRSLDRVPDTKQYLVKSYAFDWALELGDYQAFGLPTPSFLSLHQLGDRSLSDVLSAFEGKNSIFKLAVAIKNFSELALAHRWWKENPKCRVFLPRSDMGRWKWYRLWTGRDQVLNFVREGYSDASDQPSFVEWMRSLEFTNQGKFAAVLGCPVDHSFSPAEHLEFFRKQEMPFFAIDVREDEWSTALDQLREMGLHYAAVTSPLKKLAFQSLKDFVSGLPIELQSVNTLAFVNGKWCGENTDYEGIKTLLAPLALNSLRIAVWGAGGTLAPLQKLLPNAFYFSARSGELRTGHSVQGDWRPEVVIWGVGRSRFKNLPSEDWQPSQVIDLNYSENSPGREYALRVGARYTSGLQMFKTQALAQQKFWSANASK